MNFYASFMSGLRVLHTLFSLTNMLARIIALYLMRLGVSWTIL